MHLEGGPYHELSLLAISTSCHIHACDLDYCLLFCWFPYLKLSSAATAAPDLR